MIALLLVVFTFFASQSTATACSDSPNPRYPCSSVTDHMCYSNSPWHDIVTQDCPATCGVCGQPSGSDCSDTTPFCQQSQCQDQRMKEFVNKNCKKTCNRCSVSSSSVSMVSHANTCTSYPPDSSSACAEWAHNGYCTHPFYHNAERRKLCATTCKIC